MLVLSRKEGQRIFIGRDICIEVLGVRSGGKVAIGITAPAGCVIMREELLPQMAVEAACAAIGHIAEPEPRPQVAIA